MHAAAQNLRGGYLLEVSASGGQGIIEYVLIIVVIGLVIVFAGPAWPEPSATSSTWSQHGEQWDGWRRRGRRIRRRVCRYRFRDRPGAIAKDAKDWTLEEQKAVAEDIAAKGEASSAFAKAEAAMNAGTKFSMKLTDGQTLEYKIIGINHDDLADGSGKAGLTFLATSTGIKSRVNATNTNAGGWEKSELRAKMNSGEIWNLMPSDFQSKVKPVRKLTNNVDGTDKNAAVTATSDKLFMLSYSEIVETPYNGWSGYSWIGNEGTQYEAFKGKVTANYNSNPAIALPNHGWWGRSVDPGTSTRFLLVGSGGDLSTGNHATASHCVCPAWCF